MTNHDETQGVLTPDRAMQVDEVIWKEGYNHGRADGEKAGYHKGATVLSRGWFVLTLLVWTMLGFAGGISAPKWYPILADTFNLPVEEWPDDKRGSTYTDQP